MAGTVEKRFENPFGKAAVESAWTLMLVNQRKTEALQVMRKARIVERFSFNFEQMVLFNLGMAKYLVQEQGGEAARFLRDPVNQMLAKVPIVKIIPTIIEQSQREDEAVVKALTEEMKPMLEENINVGQYLPRSILDAANIVSTVWLESQERKEDFLMAVEKRATYLKNIVLRKKSS